MMAILVNRNSGLRFAGSSEHHDPRVCELQIMRVLIGFHDCGECDVLDDNDTCGSGAFVLGEGGSGFMGI